MEPSPSVSTPTTPLTTLTQPFLGLIGGGYWGKNLIREFHKIGALHTICEIDLARIQDYQQQYPSIQTTQDWEQVLANPEITAVCISLPAEMHYEYAVSALLAEKDVYVEKPITLSLDQAQALLELAKSRSKILMVGHLLHYHSAIIRMKDWIAKGRLGKIRNIVSNRLNLGKFRTSENVLWSFAPHDISVILSLSQNRLPDRVYCHGKAVLTPDIPDITNTFMSFESEGQDIYANINVNWLNPYKEQKLVIIGERGMLLFDDLKRQEKLAFYPEYLEWDSNSQPHPVRNEPIFLDQDIDYSAEMTPLERECRHFVECTQSRSRPITDGEEGLMVLQVLHMAQESLYSSLENSTTNSESSQRRHSCPPSSIEPMDLDEDETEEMLLKKQTPPLPNAFNGLIKAPEGYFYHVTATIDPGAEIGKGTKIWHYTHVCDGAKIGEDCSLGQNCFVAKGAILGDCTRVQNNVSVYDGVETEPYVFLGPSCVLTNDLTPRVEHSKNGKYEKTYIQHGATIGANATIVCGNRIGKYAMIGAGAVITKNVASYAVMVGNPAKCIGYRDEKGNQKSLFGKK